MVYANLNNPKNFVFDGDKNLYFIDLGSFQDNAIVDLFLFGSKPYNEMDNTLFKESYLAAGGSDTLFKNEEFLKLSHFIRMGAFHLRAYDKLPLLDWRKRKARFRRFNSMISELGIYVKRK